MNWTLSQAFVLQGHCQPNELQTHKKGRRYMHGSFRYMLRDLYLECVTNY